MANIWEDTDLSLAVYEGLGKAEKNREDADVSAVMAIMADVYGPDNHPTDADVISITLLQLN
jgi:hypothetical protein